MTKTLTVLRQWVDSSARTDEKSHKTNWLRVVPFMGLHLGCFAVIWVGISPVAVGVALGLYALRIFCIGAFLHRYFAHKSYKTSRVAQFIFAVLSMTAIQRGPLWWAAHHRNHHAHSDTPQDPHSPKQVGFLKSHMGWFLDQKHFHFDESRIQDFMRFKELMWLDRFDVVVPLLFGATLYGIGEWLAACHAHLNTSGLQLLVWGFFISTICVYHVTFSVNSFAHRFGKRAFETKDDSRNNRLLAILCFGEGWHNNHHRYAACARQGFKWWQIDFTYYMLRLMGLLGIIWDIKEPPRKLVA